MARKSSFTLRQLMQIADDVYPDGLIMQVYLHQKKKPGSNETCGDTQALFLVRELLDTFNPTASKSAQLIEAMRVVRRAANELESVHSAFDCAFLKHAMGSGEEE